jgi:transcription initiation factor IIE alpha subunit
MFQPVPRFGGAGCSRVQRQAQILFILWDQAHPEPHAQRANTGEMAGALTVGQIAAACDMSASPHLRAMLLEMYDAGWISAEQRDYRPNMPAYYWRIIDEVRYSAAWQAAFDAYLMGEQVLQW